MDAHGTAMLVAIGLPGTMVLVGAAVQFTRRRSMGCLLQLIGAAAMAAVVVTHICEQFKLLPWMGWGLTNSAGHYVDLASALAALTLFPLGYLLRALAER